MKIELIKEVKPLGEILYWVKVNDSFLTSLTTCFNDEERANRYYNRLIQLDQETNKEPSLTVLKSYTK
jgi:hypothetical protein